MPRRDHRLEAHSKQRVGDDIGRNLRQKKAYPERSRSCPQSTQRTSEALRREGDRQVGELVAERLEAIDEGRGGDQWVDRDRELGLETIAAPRGHCFETRRARKHEARLIDQHSPDGGERRSISVSIEETDPLQLLEGRDRLADRRLRAA